MGGGWGNVPSVSQCTVGVICRMQNVPYLFFDIWTCEEEWGWVKGAGVGGLTNMTE